MVTGLKFAAALFWVVCAWFIFIAFRGPMTVPMGADQVANLQLMHIQSMNTIIGVGAGIVGAIFAVAAAFAQLLIEGPRPSDPTGSGQI